VVTDRTIHIDNDVVLDGGGNLTVHAEEYPFGHRVFRVSKGITAELRGFMVTNGNAGGGGGGIFNEGRLTLINSTVSGNNGGIENSSGTLTLTNSTVSGNDGRGIWSYGVETLTLTNSTVSGNHGVGIVTLGALTLINSTVSGNHGVGILTGGALTLTNSVTNSVVDGDCFQGSRRHITSLGYNIESPGDTCGFDHPTDQTGVTEGQLKLGELADNGGPTMTHALGDGSVAIDVIPADMCEVDTDQRGEPRPGGSMCDVGAFEVQP
jgi:parallel beta-helix repeat protein